MSSETSRPKRTIIPNRRTRDLASIADAILAPRKKSAPKRSTKNNAKKALPPPSESSSDSDIEVQPSQINRSSQKQPSINVEEQEFTVSCTALYDNKKVWFDVNVCRLGTFKVHDFNAKTIIAVTKEAERLKTGFELASCAVTIGAPRLKQCAKMLEDPNDWESVEKMIQSYMKEGIKNLRVDYVVNYHKKRKLRVMEAIHDDDLNEDVDTSTVKKRKVYAF